MPNNTLLNRSEWREIVGDKAKFIRAMEEMQDQTTTVFPDQFNLLLELIYSTNTSAESAAIFADLAQRAAEAAQATFATLPDTAAQIQNLEGLIASAQAIALSTLPDAGVPTTLGQFYAVASEDLAANDVVNVHDVAGVTSVRKADGALLYEACGWVDVDVATGATATVRTIGNITGLSGLTEGLYYYVSDATPGAITSTAPTTPGTVAQNIGVAVGDTELAFKSQPGIFIT